MRRGPPHGAHSRRPLCDVLPVVRLFRPTCRPLNWMRPRACARGIFLRVKIHLLPDQADRHTPGCRLFRCWQWWAAQIAARIVWRARSLSRRARSVCVVGGNFEFARVSFPRLRHVSRSLAASLR
ncbi:MAG: hypothetical protein MZV64_24130 [Ignavibacteriales bacterium]|nr:hypothetical protein [Ignavibacteriales bacterium]